jgi:hypothetical protein
VDQEDERIAADDLDDDLEADEQEAAVGTANLAPGLAALEARCAAVGLETERRELGDGTGRLRIAFPNGRSHRWVTFLPSHLDSVEQIPLEHIRFLGDYEAIVDTSTGEIEASIHRLNRLAGVPSHLWRIPGAEILVEPEIDRDESGREVRDRRPWDRPKSWRLRVEREKVTAEISPMSCTLARVLGMSGSRFERLDSLKINGVRTSTEQDALAVLEDLGNALLFEIDIVAGVSLGLDKVRSERRAMLRDTTRRAVSFPRNRYPLEPLALYSYGRSATGLPLLEYLAYYQAVEYFFPAFANLDVVHRVATLLRDPAFEASDELSITRLIGLAQTSTHAGSEREQLRLAIRASVEANDLRTLILSDTAFTEHFCSKKQSISGVRPIQLDGTVDVRDQVADRIYAIRCRVVHAKLDGGEAQVDLLLPTSREARSLGPDIALMRLVARRVLVERAVMR